MPGILVKFQRSAYVPRSKKLEEMIKKIYEFIVGLVK